MRDRRLHPAAWWLWAGGLAVACSRTTNPVLLLLAISVAALVVERCRTDAPWSRSFGTLLRLGALVVLVRVVFSIVLAAPGGTHVLLVLPALSLPGPLAGLHLLGPLTAEALLAALYDGLRLAAILACLGAAASLASPRRLLATLPAAAYEAGVALVVATSFTPLLVEDLSRIRQARRLRGRSTSGLRALRETMVPVLEGALERSITLAAAMDSRGYGRRRSAPPALRAMTTGLLLAGLLATGMGAYGVLAAGSPPLLGAPLLLAGVVGAAGGLLLAGRRVPRTRYRPERMTPRSVTVTASGLLAGLIVVLWGGEPGLTGPVSPPAWPDLPPVAGLAIALAALPAAVAGRRP